MEIILTEAERAQIVAQREESERLKLTRDILKILDPSYKGDGYNVMFDSVVRCLCIETLRGLYAGVKSRPQVKGRIHCYYDD